MTTYYNSDITLKIECSSNYELKKLIKEGEYEIELPPGTSVYEHTETVGENGNYVFSIIDSHGQCRTSMIKVDNIDRDAPILVSESLTYINRRQAMYRIKLYDPISGVDYVDAEGDKKINTGTKGEFFEAVFTFDRNRPYHITAADRAGNVYEKTINVTDIVSPRPFTNEELLDRIYLVAMKPNPNRIVRGPSPWIDNNYSDSDYRGYKLGHIDKISIPHVCGPVSLRHKTTNDLRLFRSIEMTGKNVIDTHPPSGDFNWIPIIESNVNFLPATVDYFFVFHREDGSFSDSESNVPLSFDVDGDIEMDKDFLTRRVSIRPKHETGNDGDGVLNIRERRTGQIIKTIELINDNTTPIEFLIPAEPIVNYVLSADRSRAKVWLVKTEEENDLEYKIDDGPWQTYTDEFYLENMAVMLYARQRNIYGYGAEASMFLNLLNIGENLPKHVTINDLEVNTGDFRITMEGCDQTDEIEYRIGNEPWQAYVGSFIVTNSCQIRARGVNAYGFGPTALKEIEIIVRAPFVDITYNNVHTKATVVLTPYRDFIGRYRIENNDFIEFESLTTIEITENCNIFVESEDHEGTVSLISMHPITEIGSIPTPRRPVILKKYDPVNRDFVDIEIEPEIDDNNNTIEYTLNNDAANPTWLSFSGALRIHDNVKHFAARVKRFGITSSVSTSIIDLYPTMGLTYIGETASSGPTHVAIYGRIPGEQSNQATVITDFSRVHYRFIVSPVGVQDNLKALYSDWQQRPLTGYTQYNGQIISVPPTPDSGLGDVLLLVRVAKSDGSFSSTEKPYVFWSIQDGFDGGFTNI